jgi:hypothetical protein
MVLVNGDQIKTILISNLSLRNTLRPQWTITHYCGILLDWCVPSTNENKSVCLVIRTLSCVFFFIFHFLMMLFQFVQLMICITKMKTVHDIIPNLIWLSGLPLSITTQLRYLLGRRKVLAFFEAWADLEKKINIEKNCKDAEPCIKRARFIIFIIYTLLWAGIIIGIGYVVVEYSHSPYLMSSQKVLKDSLGIPLITFLHLFDLSLHFIVISLSDVVPAFVFYHAAWGIRTLAEELDQSLAALNNISQVEMGDAVVQQQLKDSSVFLIGSFSVRLRRTWYR